MTDTDINRRERRIQQFIDQELSGEERVTLLVEIGRDQDLRERVIALERLTADVKRLPRPVVPDDFVARVMRQTAPTPSIWRRAVEMLFAPRALQWNLAGAGAAAVVLLAAMTGFVATQRASPPAPATGFGLHATRVGDDEPAAADSPTTPTPVLVRLVVLQPDAASVEIAGDFNGWEPRRTPLVQMSNGAWTVTLPLRPGRYEYMFVVNGRDWVGDPLAAEQKEDGFGSRNSVLEVRSQVEAAL